MIYYVELIFIEIYFINSNNNKYNINFSKQETFHLKCYTLYFYFTNNC